MLEPLPRRRNPIQIAADSGVEPAQSLDVAAIAAPGQPQRVDVLGLPPVLHRGRRLGIDQLGAAPAADPLAVAAREALEKLASAWALAGHEQLERMDAYDRAGAQPGAGNRGCRLDHDGVARREGNQLVP